MASTRGPGRVRRCGPEAAAGAARRLSPEAAQKHIDAQMSLEEKRRLADYVIENDGDMADLERQVRAVIEKIKTT